MRIGNFECECVNNETLQKYHSKVVSFFREVSSKQGVGYIVISCPTAHGFAGIASVYDTEKSIVSVEDDRALHLIEEIPDYADERDFMSIDCSEKGEEDLQGDNILVFKNGLVFSGRQVGKWVL